jgi:hypothetical protein
MYVRMYQNYAMISTGMAWYGYVCIMWRRGTRCLPRDETHLLEGLCLVVHKYKYPLASSRPAPPIGIVRLTTARYSFPSFRSHSFKSGNTASIDGKVSDSLFTRQHHGLMEYKSSHTLFIPVNV